MSAVVWFTNTGHLFMQHEQHEPADSTQQIVVGGVGGWKQLWCQSSAVPPEICLILFSVDLWPTFRGGHWHVRCPSFKRVFWFNEVYLSTSPVAVGAYRSRKAENSTWSQFCRRGDVALRDKGRGGREDEMRRGEGKVGVRLRLGETGLWKQLEARGWKLKVLEGGCRSEREGEEGSARGLLRQCFSCQPAINKKDRAVARVCQGCRWHFCHGCDWHLPYCSTHCTFSVLYDALNEGRNTERGRNGETGRNRGGSRTVLRNPTLTQVMGLRALSVPDEPCQKEDSAICQKVEKTAGRRGTAEVVPSSFSISVSTEGRS